MTGRDALDAALAAFPNKPRMDLVGPTADDDIRRAISRYGAKEVLEAAKRQAKPKRGRPFVASDLPELRKVFEADARDWLNGGNPFVTRAPYSIAKDFADKYPGQSHPSTMKRIERKLGKHRIKITLVLAESFGKYDYPHSSYIRTVKELIEKIDAHYYGYVLNFAEAQIADYEAKNGAMPAPDLSMRKIELAVRNAFSPQFDPDADRSRGLFGLAGTPIKPAAE